MSVLESVVLEIGSVFIKAGFGGESSPRVVLPTGLRSWLHAEQKSRRRTSDTRWRDVLGGLLQEVLVNRLQCRPRSQRLVVLEPLFAPWPFRRALAAVCFEYCGVPELALLPSPLPALFATGALTGLVLDIGRDEARAFAVVDGRPLLPGTVVVSRACGVQTAHGEEQRSTSTCSCTSTCTC